MIVFVVNCGSSSIKYQLINMNGEKVLAKGLIERIGMDGSVLKHTPEGKYTVDINIDVPDHNFGIKLAVDALVNPDYGVIKSMSEIDAVGHRVVHGGERFSDSVLVTPDVLEGIAACIKKIIRNYIPLSPLHNPAGLAGIEDAENIFPGIPNIGVFDTEFHQTMPEKAYLYGLPYELYVKYGVRRYGFHGTSHKYVAQEAARMVGGEVSDYRIITCHLGNGSSVAAVKYGKSIDTSMGYTPLDGLVMGTRSGEIDPAIIPFLIVKENMDAEQIDEYLNRRSGVLGISGLSSDFRDLESAAHRGDERSQLAIDVFAYRVKKYIGAYTAAMGGVDAIVFTAGLGENSSSMREKICEGLEYLGTGIDPVKNKVRGKNQEISIDGAKVKIFVVPTNEELVIARDTVNICRRIIKL